MRKQEHHDDLEEVVLLAEMDTDEIVIKQTNAAISREQKKSFKNSFFEYSDKVNWKVFGAICLFTLGSWLDICGNLFY